MGLNSGDLDREIVLETATQTQSDSGEPIVTWGGAETVWAQWLSTSTREVFRLQREGSYIDGLFRIYDKSPRPTPEATRVVFEERLYDVTGVVEIGRGEGLELLVVAHGETP